MSFKVGDPIRRKNNPTIIGVVVATRVAGPDELPFTVRGEEPGKKLGWWTEHGWEFDTSKQTRKPCRCGYYFCDCGSQ